VARRPVLVGGLLGGVTHPLLDGLMHADIKPFLPFSTANPLLGLVPVGSLLWFCVATGILAGMVMLCRRSLWRVAAKTP